MRVFVLERVIPLLVIHMCKQSVHHVSRTKYLWSIVSIGRQCPVKSILGIFLFLIVHGPGAKPSYKNKKNCPWAWSMTGGPWTRSMKVVHGPGPKWGSMDPWSMFCPHPVQASTLNATNKQLNTTYKKTFPLEVDWRDAKCLMKRKVRKKPQITISKHSKPFSVW